MARRYYSSTAQATTLNGSINNTTTTVVVTATTGFPGSLPYTLIIDPDTVNEEVITVTSAASTTLTVTRGVDGTTAVAHSSGAVVRHGVSARDFDEPNGFLNGSGTAAVAAGTAAAPTIAFSGDTNTGIYSPGADRIGFAAGGTSQMEVQAGGLRFPDLEAGGGGSAISRTATDYPIVIPAAYTTNYFRPLLGVVEAGQGVASAILSVDTGASAAQGLVFATGNTSTLTERMRIDSDGLITGTGSLGAWTAYTPTVTAGTGTPTTTTNSGYYVKIGKLVVFKASLGIDNKGTAAGSIIFTLPVNSGTNAQYTPIYGWEFATTGYAGTGYISDSTTAAIRKYDWTTFWVDGYVVKVAGVYEAA